MRQLLCRASSTGSQVGDSRASVSMRPATESPLEIPHTAKTATLFSHDLSDFFMRQILYRVFSTSSQVKASTPGFTWGC